jgi:hypothetical protein
VPLSSDLRRTLYAHLSDLSDAFCRAISVAGSALHEERPPLRVGGLRDLGYVQLAIVEISNRKIAPQLLKYFH